jgi:hypothetical protein
MIVAVTEPPVIVGWPEFGIFMLANAIIWGICFPKLWVDIKRWRAEKRA